MNIQYEVGDKVGVPAEITAIKVDSTGTYYTLSIKGFASVTLAESDLYPLQPLDFPNGD